MNAYSIKIIVLINVQYFLSLIVGVVLLINDHTENSEYLFFLYKMAAHGVSIHSLYRLGVPTYFSI